MPFLDKPHLFVDEVQEIIDWERVVNSLLADGLADVTITVPNAGLLSSEPATRIAGGYVQFAVLSFT